MCKVCGECGGGQCVCERCACVWRVWGWTVCVCVGGGLELTMMVKVELVELHSSD